MCCRSMPAHDHGDLVTRYGSPDAQCWPTWTGDPLAVTAPADARTRATDPPPHKRVGLQARLAAWAYRWLLPIIVTVLIVLDFAQGINWATASVSDLAAQPAYAPAQRILSMDAYGAILVGAASLAALSCFALGRAWVTGWLVGPLLGGIWAWWTILYVAAAQGEGATYAGAIYALGLATLHLLAGLAVTHRTGTNTKLHRV